MAVVVVVVVVVLNSFPPKFAINVHNLLLFNTPFFILRLRCELVNSW